jgi:hypothetical protein
VILQSDALLLRIDAGHGAEVIDLVDRRTGRQLLGRPPFASRTPRAGDLDEETWTASYRGGWQLLTPNAGSACAVAGALHGFHGRASNDPWQVLEHDMTGATLRWAGHGLAVERRFSVKDATVHADVRWESAERTPLLAVEHVALGIELLDPEVVIELPGGRAVEMAERTGPPRAPDDAPLWPEMALADGSRECGDRWPLTRARSRLACVQDVPEGTARVINALTGAGVALTWDRKRLPHVWIWHEIRTSGGPWRGMTEMLVIEPASVPHHLGLETAIVEGQASWTSPGQPFGYRLSVTVLAGDG